MSPNKLNGVFILACCLLGIVAAYPKPELNWDMDMEPTLVRHVRSPQHGSVVLQGSDSPFGREVSAQYNHNLFTSGDGRGTIDAYAQASRNFDHNFNDFGGGIQGRWSF